MFRSLLFKLKTSKAMFKDKMFGVNNPKQAKLLFMCYNKRNIVLEAQNSEITSSCFFLKSDLKTY